jgi:NTP pyrophosphatase (non-canonical NTP hydrolase)
MSCFPCHTCQYTTTNHPSGLCNTCRPTPVAAKTAKELLAQDEALDLILRERDRQDALKAAGKFDRTCADAMTEFERLAVLAEEFGEVAKEVQPGQPVHVERLRAELSQVAAVCLAWLEGLGKMYP